MVSKSFSSFHKGVNYKDGYRSKCKPCMSSYFKERNKDPEVKARARTNSYKTKYGITINKYDEMLKQQNGVCKLCGSAESKRGDHRLMVDHDHVTGEVRGLLCNPCNAAIGLLGDNISTLQNAINYLSTTV
jgi:hypothetical protein